MSTSKILSIFNQGIQVWLLAMNSLLNKETNQTKSLNSKPLQYRRTGEETFEIQYFSKLHDIWQPRIQITQQELKSLSKPQL